jgi:hypothetical protein
MFSVRAQRAASEGWEGSGQVPFLLAELPRGSGGRSMRAVEGNLGHSLEEGYNESNGPSPGLRARPGKSIAKQSEGRAAEKYLPVDGRLRKLRAVEDRSAPIPEEITSKLGGSLCSLTRGPQGDQQGCHSKREKQGRVEGLIVYRISAWPMAVSDANSTAYQA